MMPDESSQYFESVPGDSAAAGAPKRLSVEELRAAARELGFQLVHRDRLRTCTASMIMSKREIAVAGDRVEHLVLNDLANQLARFLVKHNWLLRLDELPHEWAVEYRIDLCVVAGKSLDPLSADFVFSQPSNWAVRP